MAAKHRASEMPAYETIVNGRRGWLIGGRLIWAIAGGDGTDDDPKPGEGDPAGTDGGQQTGKDGQPFDAARAQSTIEALRSEIKGLKATSKEAEALRAKVTEFEREKLSETERKDAELADLKAKLTDQERRYQDALIQTAIEREAMKAGAIDPDVVFALVDRSAIAFDDDGRVKGADKAVKALLDAKPYLKNAENGNGGTTRSVPPTGRANGTQPSRDEAVKNARQELAQRPGYARL